MQRLDKAVRLPPELLHETSSRELRLLRRHPRLIEKPDKRRHMHDPMTVTEHPAYCSQGPRRDASVIREPKLKRRPVCIPALPIVAEIDPGSRKNIVERYQRMS